MKNIEITIKGLRERLYSQYLQEQEITPESYEILLKEWRSAKGIFSTSKKYFLEVSEELFIDFLMKKKVSVNLSFTSLQYFLNHNQKEKRRQKNDARIQTNQLL